MDRSIVKIRRDFRDWVRVKVTVDAGLERLKVIICSWEDGQGKRVPVSRSHRDKRIGECVCSVSIQFKRIGVLNLRESCSSSK